MKQIIVLLTWVATFAIAQGGFAQHNDEHHATTFLKRAPSLEAEHEAIHKELSALLNVGGATGSAAQAVAKALHEHFEAEERYAMPQLGSLADVANRSEVKHAEHLIHLSNQLRKHLPDMLKEHEVIRARVRELREAGIAEQRQDAVDFADKLALHAQNEEEILYPAAILIGEVLVRRKQSK
jgi:hypothetical protein